MTAKAFWLRSICVGGAVGTAFWAFTTLKAIPANYTIEHMADRLARGDSYDPTTLQSAAAAIESVSHSTCDARYLSDAVLIQAKAVDLALATGKLDMLDSSMDEVVAISERLIACAPMASLGWLGLYWMHVVRDGFDPQALVWLSNSYELGQRESWIAVRRNPLAFSVFDQLQPELQARVLDEFVDLVKALLLDKAAAQFVKLDPAVQQRLIAKLSSVEYPLRYGLFRRLRRLGVEDLPEDNRHRSDSPWID